MDKDLENKVINILNSPNLKDEIVNLSYEEKEKILTSKKFSCHILVTHCIDEKIQILNAEESIFFYKNNPAFFFSDEALFRSNLLNVIDLNDDIIIEIFNNRSYNDILSYVKDKSKIKELYDASNSLAVYSYLSDTDKIENLEKVEKNQRCLIVTTLSSDELKIKLLSKFHGTDRGLIIESFQSDELKKEYLHSYTFNKSGIICSFSNDEDKEKYLRKYFFILSQDDRAYIISSFKDEKYILKYIKYINSDNARDTLLTSSNLQSKEIINKIFSEIKSDKYLEDFYNFNLIDKNVIIERLMKIRNKKTLIKVIRNLPDLDVKLKILSSLDKKIVEEYINEYKGEYLEYQILLLTDNANLILDVLSHQTIDVEYEDEMLPLFRVVANKYNVNLDRLTTLAIISNCGILQVIENKNILNILNYNEEEFQNFIKIFNNDNKIADISAQSTVVNSLLQRDFTFKNPDIINTFVNTVRAIQDGNYEYAIQIINEVFSIIDINKYNISFDSIITGIKNNDDSVIKIYNDITKEYIMKKRNQYIQANLDKALEDFGIWEYNPDEFSKYLISVVPENMLLNIIKTCLDKDIIYDEAEMLLIKNEELLKEIIHFRKNSKEYSMIPEDVKKNMKLFNQVASKIIYAYGKRKFQFPLQKNYKSLQVSPELIVKLLTIVDADMLKDKVLNDNDVLSSLYAFLKKYKIIGCAEVYDSMEFDVGFNPDIIASLISNYSTILKIINEKKERGENVTFIAQLDIAACFDSDASIYSHLLGINNYEYIKRNPSPNSSPISKEERLNKAIELTRKLHKRNYITVPPIDEDIELDGKKKINVSIGNATDLINLTLGERTGACMRIGGAGESLFEFCLLNENGFHITFNDPNNGNLISRVSGFRNGNTVFLNQLRTSINSKYSNDDLKKACDIVANMLIELTKNSEYPIENVVISNGYAYTNGTIEDLGVSNIKKTLPNFYSDVYEQAIIVATSNNGSLVPLKLGAQNAEKYEVSRSKVKKTTSKDARNAIKHIESLDQLYDGLELDDINIREIDSIYCIYGEDWYISLDSNFEISSYIMKNSKNQSKAMEEINKYMKAVLEYKNSIQVEEGEYTK